MRRQYKKEEELKKKDKSNWPSPVSGVDKADGGTDGGGGTAVVVVAQTIRSRQRREKGAGPPLAHHWPTAGPARQMTDNKRIMVQAISLSRFGGCLRDYTRLCEITSGRSGLAGHRSLICDNRHATTKQRTTSMQTHKKPQYPNLFFIPS